MSDGNGNEPPCAIMSMSYRLTNQGKGLSAYLPAAAARTRTLHNHYANMCHYEHDLSIDEPEQRPICLPTSGGRENENIT
jgi:hypothetical protein